MERQQVLEQALSYMIMADKVANCKQKVVWSYEYVMADSASHNTKKWPKSGTLRLHHRCQTSFEKHNLDFIYRKNMGTGYTRTCNLLTRPKMYREMSTRPMGRGRVQVNLWVRIYPQTPNPDTHPDTHTHPHTDRQHLTSLYEKLSQLNRKNKIAFQSKVDHPRMCVFGYACMTIMLL